MAMWINGIGLALALAMMIAYRAYRRHLARLDRLSLSRLVVGVDVDGVLADQIVGVLPQIKQRLDVDLTRADIVDWRLPIKTSDIGQEIERSLENREYVLSMPVHDGARSTLKFIRKRNRVLVITARKGAAIEWTADWLRRNRLPFDEFVGGAQVNKSIHATDVLIDDYLGNIIEFLENTPGVAVLVDQPWNRQQQTLEPFLKSGRAFVVSNLPELRMRWPQISGGCLERKAAPS